jgi:hypothetical protein
MWGLRPDISYCQTVASLLMWGALSDERTGRLQFLVALASTVILGFDSRGTRDHILLSHIRDFPFRRLLRLAELRWRYSTPPPHGNALSFWTHFSFKHSAQTPRKTVHIVDEVTALHSTVRYAEIYLPSRCLETDSITPLLYCFVLILLSSGCSCASTVLAWSKCATIYLFS